MQKITQHAWLPCWDARHVIMNYLLTLVTCWEPHSHSSKPCSNHQCTLMAFFFIPIPNLLSPFPILLSPFPDHRNVYVGIHIPYSYHKQKKHHHGRHRKRLKQKGEKGGIMEELDQIPGKMGKCVLMDLFLCLYSTGGFHGNDLGLCFHGNNLEM